MKPTFYNKLTNNIYFEFVFGAFGIYFFSFISSVIHEKLLTKPYYSLSKQTSQIFTYPVGLLIFPYLSGWTVGNIVGCFSSQPFVKIPKKNLILCAATIFIATLTYNIAIVETSYPIVVMVRSCSILSVIIVGVFCSRVKDQKNKLGKNKLIVGALVTIGIFLFNIFMPQNSQQKTTSFFGFALLTVSLVADGFLPDFQAQIKTIYKPKPVDLMSQINKWVFIVTLLYSIFSRQLLPILYFLVDHPRFTIDLLLNACMNVTVQFFVYYLIQNFRQHIVPFVITIRKILSVVISILWFNHSIVTIQWIGVVVVLSAAIFDFVYQKCLTSSTRSSIIKIQPQKARIMQKQIQEDNYSSGLEDEIEKALQGVNELQDNNSKDQDLEPQVVK